MTWPEHGWTTLQHVSASEGWDIFYVRTPTRRYQLQRDDEAEVFSNDREAWSFVAEKAREGDVTANVALSFLAEYSPREYEDILKHTT